MSVDYEASPASAIKYNRLKADVSSKKIKGLYIGIPSKGSYIPKGVSGAYYIKDRNDNYLFVYKLNKKGDALFTAYGLTNNDPYHILDKISEFYKCDYIDEHQDKFVPYKYGKGVKVN